MTKNKTDIVLRKPSQEVEIDHLLAEEFSCDPSFAERFIKACGLICSDFKVSAVIPEPSLGGEGFGDLLVCGTVNGLKSALLIEDKITAGAGVRQAERYASHAIRMRDQGWDKVWTVLVAPQTYRVKRNGYDASVNLEEVALIIISPDPVRLAYRRGIIERALKKKASTGVKVPDIALYNLKDAYFNYASKWCLEEKFALKFPALCKSYYDGDSWVEQIRYKALPEHVKLRHRFWTSIKEQCGSVDLIISPATKLEENLLNEYLPVGSVLRPYSKKKIGVQVSFPVAEMRQIPGFSASTTRSALIVMRSLVLWYLEKIKPPSDAT